MIYNIMIGIDLAKNVFQGSWSFAFRRGQVSAEAVPAAFFWIYSGARRFDSRIGGVRECETWP